MNELKAVLAWIGRSSRRIAVSLVGAALLGAGLVMVVTPGPGLPVVLLGLLVLGTEYAWARRVLETTRERAARTARRVRDRTTRRRTKERGGAR